MKCQQCPKPAQAMYRWLTSWGEPQECPLCDSCADLIWEKFKDTAFGQTLAISTLNSPEAGEA